MAEEANECNTKKIIAVIAGVAVVIAAVVVTIVLINNNKNNDNNGNNNSTSKTEVLNDDFFKTTDKKIVMSTTSDSTDSSVAKKVHQVYFIDGDKITGVKVYSEFDSEQAAKNADAKPEVEEAIKDGTYTDHKVEGKYLIVTMPESVYQSLTVEQLKMTVEAIENAIKNGADQQTGTDAETQTDAGNQTSTSTDTQTDMGASKPQTSN